MHSDWLSALQVGDDSPARLDELVRFDPEHVVPRTSRSPDLVVLQQVRVDEDAQLLLKPKGGHATSGFVTARLSTATVF